MPDAVDGCEFVDVDAILRPTGGLFHAEESWQGDDGNSDSFCERETDCGRPLFRKIEWFEAHGSIHIRKLKGTASPGHFRRK